MSSFEYALYCGNDLIFILLIENKYTISFLEKLLFILCYIQF